MEIRRLKDELHTVRRALVDLMPPEAQAILWSCYRAKTDQEWAVWPEAAADKIVELCTGITQRTYQGQPIEPPRAKCPLCRAGPQSYYDGHLGFALPEGLMRHLTGYGRSHECPVFGAARAIGRESRQSWLELETSQPTP
jgi:hypothetical protein